MRGKNAAKAANRRATEASERIAQLEQQLAELRARHSREMADLKTELMQARGRLTSEVRKMSELEVNTARGEAEELVREMRERHRQQISDGMQIIYESWDPELPLDTWPRLAKTFGVEVGDILHLSSDEDSRRVRRMTNQKAMQYLDEYRQMPTDWPSNRFHS